MTERCGCPVNAAGDSPCHRCGEYVNVRCWNCKTPRGVGTCPHPIAAQAQGREHSIRVGSGVRPEELA